MDGIFYLEIGFTVGFRGVDLSFFGSYTSIVWKGNFWQFEKENFDSLEREILTVLEYLEKISFHGESTVPFDQIEFNHLVTILPSINPLIAKLHDFSKTQKKSIKLKSNFLMKFQNCSSIKTVVVYRLLQKFNLCTCNEFMSKWKLIKP